MEEIIINEKKASKSNVTFILANNGILIEASLFSQGIGGCKYYRRVDNKEFNVSGSSNIDIDGFEKGAHLILRDKKNRTWLISKEGFQNNFSEYPKQQE